MIMDNPVPDPDEHQEQSQPEPESAEIPEIQDTEDILFEPDFPSEPDDSDRSLMARLHHLATPRNVAIVAILSTVLLCLAVVSTWYILRSYSATGTDLQFTPPASLDDLATEYPELAPILQDPKLSSAYKDFFIAYQEGGPDAAYDLAQKRGLLNTNGDLRLTLELDTTDTHALQAALEANGIQVTTVSGNLMDIVVPIELIEQAMASDSAGDLLQSISGLEHILRIRLPITTIQDQGGVDTESVPIIGATQWHSAGFTGKGVKVGVLDRGFDRYRDLIGTDLPADVVVKSFIAGVEADNAGSVHGSAVSEIIYDIAPEAQLFLAAYDTDAEQAQAIDWLLSQGVQIISHSAGSVYGPMDGTGPKARLIDDVVSKHNILWVNSAGNTGYSHYRGTFTDTDGDGYHEFAPGDELMGFAPAGRVVLVLNWDDWQNGTEDYDLYIMDKDGNEIASSTDIQNGAGADAAEGVVYEFSDTGPYYAAFLAKNSTRPAVFDFFMRDGEIEYYTPEHSITTPGDARMALTVGATNWSDDALENYSSQGPTTDGRLKPDIAAPAGISSAAYGETWVGTSASTPHVAGAAALAMQAFPNMSPQEVADYLKSNAVDLGDSGPDNVFGYGRLWLGDPPSAPPPVVTQPVAPQDTPAVEPVIVNTPIPSPTANAGEATATPQQRVIGTPGVGGSNDSTSSTLGIVVGLLACVVMPGLLGMGGMILLAGVWFFRRSQPTPLPPVRGYQAGPPPGRMPPPRQTPGAAGYPERGARPGQDQPYGQSPQPAPRPAPEVDRGDQPFAPQMAPPPAAAKPGPGEVICSNCGKRQPAQSRFCTQCGHVLAQESPPEAKREEAAPDQAVVYCTRCGQALRPNSKFCPRCGQAR
jgi:hypothetical protein